ncbi:hypothetical protein SCP_1401390 [Sparassis crispa]|uniref:Uncharacterized protein n=1 Tax=Sparassis crispa TaxID=139825 RepID=A0A401H2T2_9APHY|nr:hypothetical protein SCP_1401390 [Sparassis crispa]GBE88734.1 hypothetical protein SCP_1401390 [Sparassis crispa]
MRAGSWQNAHIDASRDSTSILKTLAHLSPPLALSSARPRPSLPVTQMLAGAHWPCLIYVGLRGEVLTHREGCGDRIAVFARVSQRTPDTPGGIVTSGEADVRSPSLHPLPPPVDIPWTCRPLPSKKCSPSMHSSSPPLSVLSERSKLYCVVTLPTQYHFESSRCATYTSAVVLDAVAPQRRWRGFNVHLENAYACRPPAPLPGGPPRRADPAVQSHPRPPPPVAPYNTQLPSHRTRRPSVQ